MPIKKLLQDFNKAFRDEVLQRVSQYYGRKKNPEEIAFVDKIGITLRSYSIFLFFISFWIGIVAFSKMLIIEYKHPKMSRCVVPELEGKFSFEEILNMSVRFKDKEYRHNCHFDKRNYTYFIEKYGNNYSDIMNEISDSPNAYNQKCAKNISKKFIDEYDNVGEVHNYYDETNMYCKPTLVKAMSEISLKYGQFILSAPLGILGDFYGRKTAFLYCVGIFSAGIICTLTFQVLLVIIGRFLIGSFMILFYTSFVIFIESTTERGKKIAFLLHEGIAVGRLIEFTMYRTLRNWKISTFIHSAMCVLVLISYFFLKESARWLYFRGNQNKAYRLLGIEKPDAPSIMKHKNMDAHMKLILKLVFRKRLLIQMITIWCTSSIIYLMRYKFPRDITSFLLRNLLDSGILMGSCTILTFIIICFIGRKSSIMLYFSITGFVYSVLYLNPSMDRMFSQMLLALSVTLTENATFLTFYRISEFYSNDIRLSSYGFCCGIHGFGEIFHYHATFDVSAKSIHYAPFFFLSVLSLIATMFQSESHKPFVLPDYPREAMKDSDFKPIIKILQYERRRTEN